MTPDVKLRLVDMEEELESVELPNGQVATVKRFDGVAVELWYEWNNAPITGRDPNLLWNVAVRCLPDVEEQVVRSLTMRQAAGVLAVASGNVDRVLSAIKGGMRVEDIPALALDPTIQSAPSSSPSPEPPAEPHGASP